MGLPAVVSREEWLAARTALLAQEKELTRARDRLNADRRRLPMVEVTTPYALEGPTGVVGLLDLFEGRRQLFVQHFMFDPSWDAGCPSCSAEADEVSPGLLRHLHARDTTFAAVSRAPFAAIEAYRASQGWTFPWYSSHGTRFNHDFHVTIDESVTPLQVNYRTRADVEADPDGPVAWVLSADQPFETPGHSCFLRDGDRVFHTYSTFGRGTEAVGGAYAFLDQTALGRQEAWEQPAGRAGDGRGAVPDFSS